MTTSTVSGVRRRPNGSTAWRRLGGWPMAAIPALITVGMLVYPLCFNLWTSLHVDRLSTEDGTFVGLDNYRALIQFGQLGTTLRTTLVWTIGCLVLQAAIGFVAALTLDGLGRFAGTCRALLLIPWVMPGVVISAVWLSILNPIGGLANSVLGLVGVAPHDWLGDPSTALASLIFVNAWKGFPFWMLMIAAGLKSIPVELHEAAQLDGANYLKRIRHIVVPSMRSVLVLTALLAFIWTFNYFDLAYAMTNGGPDGATTTLAFDIYQTSFVFNRFDQGSALSVISFGLMSIAIAVYARAARRSSRGVS
jgi:ABC-type sugar transport system permease subunit